MGHALIDVAMLVCEVQAMGIKSCSIVLHIEEYELFGSYKNYIACGSFIFFSKLWYLYCSQSAALLYKKRRKKMTFFSLMACFFWLVFLLCNSHWKVGRQENSRILKYGKVKRQYCILEGFHMDFMRMKWKVCISHIEFLHPLSTTF